MERVRAFTADPGYRRYLSLTEAHETDRLFCRHTFSHLLDTARIAWILCLERGLNFPQSLVYAAALLHDIGRFAQYEDTSVDHANESANLAAPILEKHGFTIEEIHTIQKAIRTHRLPPETVTDSLGAILAEADDLSRPCYKCTAQNDCYKFNRMAAAKGIQY
ncbi:MAG: HD domain-containing protein [Clostridiales bacterium]|jgi:putative nucleotidyltransferase with HDIG domain|nr:HD domain-containing protein [Clostridiales bacterium]